MLSSDIRSSYLKFFEDRGHSVITPSPIIPTNDPTTLFTGSGMQQLVPFLKGEKHAMGTRLVDSQPCFRAEDIDEIGDNRHTTMFEMLGNWSLGDYFKDEQLSWLWEFLRSELSLDPNLLHVTLFEGNESVPKDEETLSIWHKLGVKDNHIHWYGAKKNWWSRAGTPDQMPSGEIGGPTSEVFYEFTSVEHDKSYGEVCHPNCDCGRFFEIGNSVFMEYEKTENGLKKLPAQNVDFGGGLERLTAAVQNSPDVFETDIFSSIISTIEQFTDKKYEKEFKPHMRIIADHLRAATFMMAESIEPSNKRQGSVLRRLLRRAAVQSHLLAGGLTPTPSFEAICHSVVKEYVKADLIDNETKAKELTSQIINTEMIKFGKTLDRGLKLLEKTSDSLLNEEFAFNLYQSLGFPFEITQELLNERKITLDENKFNNLLTTHQDKSRSTSAGMFKGGLADHSKEVTKLHTATHLLHKALRDVLGDEVTQAGSNITSERLRFDYTYKGKPSQEELEEIEKTINKKIEEALPVHKTIEDKDTALASGALAFFKEKYADKVSVYTIGNDPGSDWYSKELCGGPHVSSTAEIGGVTIKKEEALGAGVRRIYAVLR